LLKLHKIISIETNLQYYEFLFHQSKHYQEYYLVTYVLFEHTDKLGKTIEEIAGEKSGILKQNVPCVIGLQKWRSTLKIVRKKAEELNVPAFALGEDVGFNIEEDSFSVRIADYEYEAGNFRFSVQNRLLITSQS